MYLIESKDRETVQSKRNVLNSFFNARVFVMHVYRMLPVVTPVTGALKRVCEMRSENKKRRKTNDTK